MKKRLSVLLIFACFRVIAGASIHDTLYINRGIDTMYSQVFPSCAFNSTNVYSLANTIFKINVNDTLVISLINTDSLPHTFTVDGIVTATNVVNAHDTIVVQGVFNTPGTFRYYSALSNGAQSGASGVIMVGYTSMVRYAWNLFDRDTTFANKFAQQLVSVIDTGFHPAIFTINGLTYPASESDTTILVTAMVGDSVIISIVNSGHMSHSVHFHGFHVKILTANATPWMMGWEKDSFPLAPGATATVLLVPDKSGMYPMHDHNLIVSTNAGVYPGGIMGMLNIMP
jgi:hypothetical protein